MKWNITVTENTFHFVLHQEHIHSEVMQFMQWLYAAIFYACLNCKERCYSHDGRVWWRIFPILTMVVLYTFARGRTVSNPEINLNINFKARNRKTKTDTNPIPDPNRYRRRCPDPTARIKKFYTFIGTPEKSVHRVTIKNDSPGLAGRGGPNRWSKSTIKLFAK